MAISKVVYSGQTLIDLTGDTVSAETLAKNATAHDKAGNLIVGQLEPGGDEGGEYDAVSVDNGDGTQTLRIVTAGIPSGGSGLDVGSLEVAVIDKDVEVPERVTSDSVVWITMQDLRDAGVVLANETSGYLLTKWPNYIIEVRAKDTDFTHLANQTIWILATSGGHKGTYNYKQYGYYHESSSTSVKLSTQPYDPKSAGRYYTCIVESSLGFDSTKSILWSLCSASYGIGGGTYNVRVLLWRAKTA